MPRRFSPNFWIAPVAGATFLALYAIDHLSSRQIEDPRIEQGHVARDCEPTRNPGTAQPRSESAHDRAAPDAAGQGPACQAKVADRPS
jgi:hypothetical protein